MALCLECLNKTKNAALKREDVLLSPEQELCESCDERAHVVVKIKHVDIFRRKYTQAAKRPKAKKKRPAL